jgi:lysozyme
VRASRRRWTVLVAAGLAVVLVVIGIGWFLWFPRWRPSLHAGESYGIDVSEHQGQIDWRRVRSSHISFAYVKATEGADFVDTRFRSNWTAATGAGVRVGAYHFFTLCSSGSDQATNFLRVAPPDAAALAPAVDLELAGNCRSRPTAEAVGAEIHSFVAAVQAAWGRPPVIYERHDFAAKYPAVVDDALPRWSYRFVRRPGGRWVVWQVSAFARVPGLSGHVDLDVGRKVT